MTDSGQRGQALTLEAIAAGLVLLSSLVFALQITAVTPLSASTSSQHIENQLEASADGVLASAVEDGSLKRALLFYNESSDEFINASGDNGAYSGAAARNKFGEKLEWVFDRRGIAYNIYITYESGSGDDIRRLYYRGEPSDNAVTASTTVVLMDDDPLYDDTDGDGRAEARPVNVSSSPYFMGDESGTGLYNVVEVEVVVWRI